MKENGSSLKELIQIKDSRIQGVQDSSEMLKNYVTTQVDRLKTVRKKRKQSAF
jgi:hypothetical protein